MALLSAKDFHPDIAENDNIFKVEQIQLETRSSAPSDSDLAEGRLYCNSSDHKVYAYLNGSWVDLTTAGGGSSTLSGLSDTTISSPSSGQILVYDGTDSWDNKSISGDATLAADGTLTISDGAVSTSKIADGAVTLAKLSTTGITDGYIIRYDDSAGAWQAVDPTTLPAGTASVLAQSVTIEAGANDLTLSTATQSSSGTITIRDLNLSGGTDYFVFESASQTLTNKTLTSPTIGTQITLSQSTADYTLQWSDPSAARTLTIPDPGGNDTFVFLAASQALTNKTYNGLTLTAAADGFTISGGTTSRTLTVTGSDITLTGGGNTLTLSGGNVTLTAQAGGSSVTLPSSGTLATLDGTETLTNKTLTTPTLTTPTLNGAKLAVTTKSGAYTATTSDCVILVDASAAAVTISLPTASGNTGLTYVIKKIDSSGNNVTIDPNGSETIDGSSTVTLSSQYSYRMIVSDGSNWVVVSAA